MKIRVPNTVFPTYANFAVIDHKKDEVILNFCLAEGTESDPEGILVQKVVMHPANLKRFHTTVGELLEEYQVRYGPLE